MDFFIVDVFAEKKYQGNQLAVFVLEKPLSTTEMQQISKEMNFSETTFIESGDVINGFNVRIFTPDMEVPFAGHPTLGTAFIINKILNHGQLKEIILNLGVGKIPVTFDEKTNELWMKQNSPKFDKIIELEMIADILQINREEIFSHFPIQVVSTGLPAVIIPIKTIEAIKSCKINHKAYQTFIDQVVKANLMIFTTQTEREENNIHARVFLDDPGFLEDSATGSANGNLAAYLLEYNFLKKSKIILNVEQGYSIGRPSLIKINSEKINEIFKIFVGGSVFLIAKGIWC